MLSSLHIENMAVIRSLNVDFDAGFTVITGETGAGKSVMMESLHLLGGGKADRELIRHGEEKASVSALFAALSADTVTQLASLGVDTDDEGCLELQRIVSIDGKSIARLNGRTVSLSLLKEVFPLLLHIHSQEDSGFLRREGSELTVLDTASHNESDREAYGALYRRLTEIKGEISRLQMDESEKLRTLEMLRYQLDEIDSIAPEEGEDERLFDEKIKLKHSEKIAKQTSFAYRALRGAEKGNALYIIDRASAALRTVADVLPEATALADSLDAEYETLYDLAERIASAGDMGEGDPTERLDAVETRLSALEKLMRKYGGSLPRVLEFAKDARERLSVIEGADARIADLQKEYDALYLTVCEAAERLHESREKTAKMFEAEIAARLRELDMPRAEFSVQIERRRDGERYLLTERGFDEVTFLAAVNVGEPFIPIARSVSGGEMARIMLAIKTVIAKHDGLPTIVFDEVDTGVSGKTSRKIGFSLLASAKSAQVISITHSAQIASLAHRHLLVYKEERGGRTESSVRPLSGEERVGELARILGGIAVTEAQKQAARDMLSGKDL